MIFKIKELLDTFLYPFYVISGRRPWGGGYYTAKKRAICGGIDSGVMRGGNQLPTGYGYGIDERVVEYPWIFSQLPQIPGRVLDAGSALNHEFLLERAPLSQHNLMIMTLAPEKRCFWYKGISYIFGDLRNTELASGTFDVVASISTIEHIGLDNTMLYTDDISKKESDVLGFIPAVTEFKRILKPGGLCLITVPFGRRGVHGWYQVFDLELVMRVVEAFQPAEHTIEYFGYSPEGWRRVEVVEIADAEFFDIHEGKPLGSDFAAGARGVACLRLVA